MAEIVTSTYHGAPLVCAFIDNKLEFLEFIRNKETGILEVWKDGKKIGEIITMGDEVDGDRS